MSNTGRRDYLADLNRQLWEYRKRVFSDADHFFERTSVEQARRPPVFVRAHEEENVIVRPGASPEEIKKVQSMIAVSARHRWFSSMLSSQAFAQSVFANLLCLGKLDALAGLRADEGGAAFFEAGHVPGKATLEYEATYLGEKRKTSVDLFIQGISRAAVECKLSEAGVGSCSRPRLRPADPTFEREHCDGSYTYQRGRTERCSLTSIRVRYWEYIPELFDWRPDVDHPHCPIRYTYQLVRNVLAACVRNEVVVPNGAHALLVYDRRNPAFQPGGDGMVAYGQVSHALRDRSLLRRCSWQRILARLRQDDSLNWLTDPIERKYGLSGRDAAEEAQ